jgi:hypothetical protein
MNRFEPFVPTAGVRPMSRLRRYAGVIALAYAGSACSDASGAPAGPEPEKTEAKLEIASDPGAAMPMAPGLGAAMPKPPDPRTPESPDANDRSKRPAPVPGTGAKPMPDPTCPKRAPQPGSACSVPPGGALSCAWEESNGAIERCACVSKEGRPERAPLTWNCDDGPSGEGPATSTCPDTPPVAESPCLVRGNNCRYAEPSSIECDCDPSKMLWDCEGAPRGGAP